jgi:predicted kinase
MRISLDDLRLMLSGRTFEVGVEPAVAVAAEALLQSLPAFCAAKGWDVVFDATNVTRARRAPLIATARQHGFKPVAIFVTGSLGAALKRNAARPFPVPTPAVLNFARRLEPPSLEEGFEEVVVVDTG